MTLFRKNSAPLMEMTGVPTSKIGYLKVGPRFLSIKSLECSAYDTITSRVRAVNVAHEAVTGLIEYYDHRGRVILGADWDQTATPIHIPEQEEADTFTMTHNIRHVPSSFARVRRVIDLRGLPEVVSRTWSLQVR